MSSLSGSTKKCSFVSVTEALQGADAAQRFLQECRGLGFEPWSLGPRRSATRPAPAWLLTSSRCVLSGGWPLLPCAERLALSRHSLDLAMHSG
jgi:hypothetical protein